MLIGATESIFIVGADKSLTAFLELEAAIRAGGAIVLDEQPRFLNTPPR